jgi:hypothetical protein
MFTLFSANNCTLTATRLYDDSPQNTRRTVKWAEHPRLPSTHRDGFISDNNLHLPNETFPSEAPNSPQLNTTLRSTGNRATRQCTEPSRVLHLTAHFEQIVPTVPE